MAHHREFFIKIERSVAGTPVHREFLRRANFHSNLRSRNHDLYPEEMVQYVAMSPEESYRIAFYLLYVFRNNPHLTPLDRAYFDGMEESIIGTVAHYDFMRQARQQFHQPPVFPAARPAPRDDELVVPGQNFVIPEEPVQEVVVQRPQNVVRNHHYHIDIVINNGAQAVNNEIIADIRSVAPRHIANYLLFLFRYNPPMNPFDHAYFNELERSIIGTAEHRMFLARVNMHVRQMIDAAVEGPSGLARRQAISGQKKNEDEESDVDDDDNDNDSDGDGDGDDEDEEDDEVENEKDEDDDDKEDANEAENRRIADYLFYVFLQNPRMTALDREYFRDMEKLIVGTEAHEDFLRRVHEHIQLQLAANARIVASRVARRRNNNQNVNNNNDARYVNNNV